MELQASGTSETLLFKLSNRVYESVFPRADLLECVIFRAALVAALRSKRAKGETTVTECN